MLYLDDRLPTHPKILKAGNLLGQGGASRALHLYLMGLAYARQHLTDGFVPESFVIACGAIPKSGSIAKVLANRTVRLWRKVRGGYQIHDYHAFNPKASEVKQKREKDRQRKQLERHGRNGNLSAMDISRTRARAVPVPVPVRGRTSTNQLKEEKSVQIQLTSKNLRRASRVADTPTGQNADPQNPDRVSATVRDCSRVADDRTDDGRQRVARAHQVSDHRARLHVPNDPGDDFRRDDARRTGAGTRIGATARAAPAAQAVGAGPTGARVAVDGTADRSAVDTTRRADRGHQAPGQAA